MSETSATEPLSLIIQFNKKEYNITVPCDDKTTVKDLRDEVHKQTQVPPSLQKYIFKGATSKVANTKIKNENELVKNLALKSGTKAMLIGSTIDQVISVSAPALDDSNKKKKDDEQLNSPVPLKLSQLKEHQKPIAKGVPEGAEPGDKLKDLPLPKTIKNVYNKAGELVRLTFKPENQELWIASKDNTERIPYVQIRDIESEPIHTNDAYHIMSFQIGSAPNSKLWFYFVPAQYHKSIKYSIMGLHNFPFLQRQ